MRRLARKILAAEPSRLLSQRAHADRVCAVVVASRRVLWRICLLPIVRRITDSWLSLAPLQHWRNVAEDGRGPKDQISNRAEVRRLELCDCPHCHVVLLKRTRVNGRHPTPSRSLQSTDCLARSCQIPRVLVDNLIPRFIILLRNPFALVPKVKHFRFFLASKKHHRMCAVCLDRKIFRIVFADFSNADTAVCVSVCSPCMQVPHEPGPKTLMLLVSARKADLKRAA
jgi:hypothetical protein